MQIDHWSEGYRAGLAGLAYDASPYEGKPGACAWAFGCGEGMKERNRRGLSQIIEMI